MTENAIDEVEQCIQSYLTENAMWSDKLCLYRKFIDLALWICSDAP